MMVRQTERPSPIFRFVVKKGSKICFHFFLVMLLPRIDNGYVTALEPFRF